MNSDERQEEETEASKHPGLMERLGHAVTAGELQMIDRSIGLFERWRNRVEPPAEEDDRRHGDRRAPRAETLHVEAPAAAKHGHRRGILVIIALLLAAAFAGMMFSYSLLDRAIDSNNLIIDDLRDQLAQMEKEDARKLSIQAKDQFQIAEQKKTIREREAKLQEYEERMSQLRQQISALTPPPPGRDTVVAAGSRQLRTARPAPPQKTGNCVATGSNAAADLARCVDNFNRP